MKKYRYNVMLSAEDMTVGSVTLTKEEAALISRITDPKNWDDMIENPASGSFFIDVDNPEEL